MTTEVNSPNTIDLAKKLYLEKVDYALLMKQYDLDQRLLLHGLERQQVEDHSDTLRLNLNILDMALQPYLED